jgi:hypothetical protein
VEHSIPPSEVVRPWRTATLIATAIAGVELVLLVIAGMVLLGKSLAPHAHAATRHKARAPERAAKRAPTARRAPAAKLVSSPRAVAKLARRQTGVLVLNGNGVQGAAASAAALVRTRGYRIRHVGNAPRTGYPKTMVEYRPGFLGEARRFARDMGLGLVVPVDGMKPRQLHGAQIVLILGAAR